jgi:hypothetical protein
MSEVAGLSNRGDPTASRISLRYLPRGKQPTFCAADEVEEEIRQMIVGRYRVLFTIRKHKVHVLHVRGAHV